MTVILILYQKHFLVLYSVTEVALILFVFPSFSLSLCHRAHASTSRPHCVRDPVTPVGATVGAPGLQPDTMSHVLAVSMLPLLHRNREWSHHQQRHCARVSVSRKEHVALHVARPATISSYKRTACAVQPRGQEREQRGHVPNRRGQ